MHESSSWSDAAMGQYLNVSAQTLQACSLRAKALRPQVPTPQRWLYPNHILWQVGDWEIKRPLGEALTDLLIDHLKYTFGKEWADAQYDLPPEKRHVVMRWWFSWCESSKSMAPLEHHPGQIFGFRPTGDMMELGTLAHDLYHLRLVAALDPTVLCRLRSHDQFQGARYELAIAASMVRSGFDIRWMHGTSTHCEFVATCQCTGEAIAIEVKSRHVSGTLNRPGPPPDPDGMRFIAHRYYNEAIKQCPVDKPCAVFINLNLPPQADPGNYHIPWWPEMQKLIDALPRSSAAEPAAETCLVLTNFAGHFAGSDEAPSNRYVFTFPNYVRHPLKHADTLVRLLQAIDTYGQIPIIE
jgi:hypothetical protein